MARTGNPLPRLANALEDLTLEIDQWHTPATDYLKAEAKDYRIRRKLYARDSVYKYWGMDGYLYFRVKKSSPITSLQQRRGGQWHTWMVDDPPQQRAMEIYAEHAHGKVLVAGLGLGLYLHELAKNERVEKVTVIEISPEVVMLMNSHLPSLPEFVILLEDFYDFITHDTEQWDTILVDLWVSHSVEEKLELYYHHVIPLFYELKQKYPKADITFHGFQTVSAVKPVSEGMAKLIIDIGGI